MIYKEWLNTIPVEKLIKEAKKKDMSIVNAEKRLKKLKSERYAMQKVLEERDG